jgi:hypothetical protein
MCSEICENTRISGGNSIVFLTPADAMQTFKIEDEYNRVKTMISDLSRVDPIQVWIDSEYYSYTLKNYIAEAKSFQECSRIITWQRIECLNELDPNVRVQFIEQYIEKLLWDILKAIVGLNLSGYVHNDVSLDNIGIYNGTFILYDYNMSKRGSDMIRDLSSFKRSIRFHLNDQLSSRIATLLDYVESSTPMDDFVYIIQRLHRFTSSKEAIDYLDHLTIQ